MLALIQGTFISEYIGKFELDENFEFNRESDLHGKCEIYGNSEFGKKKSSLTLNQNLIENASCLKCEIYENSSLSRKSKFNRIFKKNNK